MSELTEEIRVLTFCVDDLHDFFTHVGLQGFGVKPSQGGDDARGQARVRARYGARGRGDRYSSSHFFLSHITLLHWGQFLV